MKVYHRSVIYQNYFKPYTEPQDNQQNSVDCFVTWVVVDSLAVQIIANCDGKKTFLVFLKTTKEHYY